MLSLIQPHANEMGLLSSLRFLVRSIYALIKTVHNVPFIHFTYLLMRSQGNECKSEANQLFSFVPFAVS